MSALLAIALLAPPTLGEALRDIGAFEAPAELHMEAPPPPPRTGAKIVIGTGLAMIVGGLVGMLASPTCVTRRADGGCVDRRGSEDVYPALVVLGVAAGTAGSFWFRRDLDAAAP